jgi:hypothetical protein
MRSCPPEMAAPGETPAGAVDIVHVSADAETGIVDWRLMFPDSGVGIAQSRVTETTRGTCIYSFVLHEWCFRTC